MQHAACSNSTSTTTTTAAAAAAAAAAAPAAAGLQQVSSLPHGFVAALGIDELVCLLADLLGQQRRVVEQPLRVPGRPTLLDSRSYS